MNTVEQRTHKRVTDTLNERISNIETCTDQLIKHDDYHHRQIETLQQKLIIASEQIETLQRFQKEALESRAHHLMCIKANAASLAEFCSQSFWQRLRWLIRGA